ncbi:fibrous sheath-interacting protein 2-like isoform X2 [Numida meleagris]|uniref:fibrous sheath-interacting protein 2-like isoform X2 n=1 Tax=Numida meleagris TaxID=8996 RepID=UPI000B3DAD33|nr:fibrous sheath-interacting protein 2-like isoform X2 [Numida meleagris]
MERCGTAGFRNPGALLSIAGKSAELRPGGQKVGARGSGLLDLPLGVKIPVQPGTKPVFCRTKLGEKLHKPSPHFDLGDPYCRQLRTEYNSLHDPHLQAYHNRKANLRNLKNKGFVTDDGKVVCTLKEFNEYRQYLTRLKLEHEETKRREEQNLGQEMSNLKKFAQRAMMDVDKSCLGTATTVDVVVEEKASSLQPCKPAGPPPSHAHQSGQRRRLKAAVVHQDLQGDSKSTGRAVKLPDKLPKLETGREGAKLPENIHTEAASARKARFPGDREFRAMSEKHREDQSLQEAVKTQVLEALEEVKALYPSACALRRASLRIRQRLLGRAERPEPSEMSPSNPEQEIALLARKIVGSVLENVRKSVESRRREASDKSSLQPSLDKAKQEAIESVYNMLQSFVASHSEEEFEAEYSETIELPTNHLSQRQPQPSQVPLSRQSGKEGRGSSEEQSLATSQREKLPAIQPRPSSADVSGLSRRIVKESMENAISKLKQEEQAQLLLKHAKSIVTAVISRVKKGF